MAIQRPKVQWEGQQRTVLHPLELAAVLTAARRHSATAHALVALLEMLGLRISETCQTQVSDLQYAGGYQVLRVLGKVSKPGSDPAAHPGAARRAHRSRPGERPDPSCSATTVRL